MNKNTRPSILAAALAASASALATTIDPSNYDYSMSISPAAGRIATTLSNFPLLVRLSSTRQPWFNPADCGTGGADLRFALADGTLLAPEIDTWNPNGVATVGVKVPTLNASTTITAKYGCAEPPENDPLRSITTLASVSFAVEVLIFSLR